MTRNQEYKRWLCINALSYIALITFYRPRVVVVVVVVVVIVVVIRAAPHVSVWQLLCFTAVIFSLFLFFSFPPA